MKQPSSIECIINKEVLLILWDNENNDIMNIPLNKMFFIEHRISEDTLLPVFLLSFGNGTNLWIDCPDAEECVLYIRWVLKDYYTSKSKIGI
jgi:hypothetical protein